MPPSCCRGPYSRSPAGVSRAAPRPAQSKEKSVRSGWSVVRNAQRTARGSSDTGLVLECDAAEPPTPRLHQQIDEFPRRLSIAHAFGPDVGEAVALAVLPADGRGPGEIDAEAVGRCEAGPLADQHGNERRIERRADLIADRHAPLLHHGRRADAPLVA